MNPIVLIVEDDADLAEALVDTLEMADYSVRHASSAVVALDLMATQPIGLVISDIHMAGMDGHALLRRIKTQWSDCPVLLMTAYGSIEQAVAAMRDGAADYLKKPFEADVLLEAVQAYLGSANAQSSEPVADDPRSRELFTLAARVARSNATIMLTGESGTGKEVMARYLHRHSDRADKPFVAINCAAIPDNMLEATLFGYEKGAYTGAVKSTPGKFELADGGTLLLDEISEMDLALQAKLLRVLQEREVERLGGGKTLKLDVRVIATSNRDMREQVKAGAFREDLYYRLNVFPLRIPALRERPGDIPRLAERSLEQAARRAGYPIPRLAQDAVERLQQYNWPGNVRELDNVMQRAVILAEEGVVNAEALYFESSLSEVAQNGWTLANDEAAAAPPSSMPADTDRSSTVSSLASGGHEGLNGDLKAREYQIILDALKRGSRKSAAEKLGISPRTLRYKIARMREEGIRVPH